MPQNPSSNSTTWILSDPEDQMAAVMDRVRLGLELAPAKPGSTVWLASRRRRGQPDEEVVDLRAAPEDAWGVCQKDFEAGSDWGGDGAVLRWGRTSQEVNPEPAEWWSTTEYCYADQPDAVCELTEWQYDVRLFVIH